MVLRLFAFDNWHPQTRAPCPSHRGRLFFPRDTRLIHVPGTGRLGRLLVKGLGRLPSWRALGVRHLRRSGIRHPAKLAA